MANKIALIKGRCQLEEVVGIYVLAVNLPVGRSSEAPVKRASGVNNMTRHAVINIRTTTSTQMRRRITEPGLPQQVRAPQPPPTIG